MTFSSRAALILALAILGCSHPDRDRLDAMRPRLDALEVRRDTLMAPCARRWELSWLPGETDSQQRIVVDLREEGALTRPEDRLRLAASADVLSRELATLALPPADDAAARTETCPSALRLPAHLSVQSPDGCLEGYGRLLWRWLLIGRQQCSAALSEAARMVAATARVPVRCAARGGAGDADVWRSIAQARVLGPAHAGRSHLALARGRYDLLSASSVGGASLDERGRHLLAEGEQALERARACFEAEGREPRVATRTCDGAMWLDDYDALLTTARVIAAIVIAARDGCDVVSDIVDPIDGATIECVEQNGRLRVGFARPSPGSPNRLRELVLEREIPSP